MNIFCSLSDKKLASITLTLIVTLAACGKQEQSQIEVQQDSTPQAISVAIKSLEASNLESSSQFLGSLEAQERVSLAPRVEGRIVKIQVKEGDRVKKGQLILQLHQDREKAQVNAAVSDINISQANVTNAEAQVKTAEAQVANFQAQLEQSKANLRRQEAEVGLAKANINRAKFLVKEGAESQQFLDNSKRDLEAALAQQEALKQALNASDKALIAAQEGVKAALANVDREKARLNQAQARVNVASENLDFNRVVAPIDGVIGNITSKVGDYLEAGDTITTITQNNVLELNIAVPIEQAERLKLGLPVIVTGGKNNEKITGKINFISPTVNPTQQSILAKAIFQKNSGLQDEQFVRARVIWSENSGVLVPTSAISRIAGQSFVFVAKEVEENGKKTLVAKQKAVQLGSIQGQAYQVISGIEPGDKLITSGILNLSDGVAITSEELSTLN